jgi:very-short-patch-repair endonuclease
MAFTKNIDELVDMFNSQKESVTRFVRKNFTEGIHFIEQKQTEKLNYRGGHNRIDMLLTEDAFVLVKNTYNLKNRYIKKINENCSHVNIVMCIETQTIGFIENSFSEALRLTRQKRIGTYYIDLYFEDYNLAIECDENDHKDRDITYEHTREKYLLEQNIMIIRYNPNDKNFDLSDVLQKITKVLFTKPVVPSVIKVDFLESKKPTEYK